VLLFGQMQLLADERTIRDERATVLARRIILEVPRRPQTARDG
jgi:hypothetical protein